MQRVSSTGEFAPSRPVTSDEVRSIRSRYTAGETQVAISQTTGVPQPTISQMVRGVGRWRDLPAVLPPPKPPRPRLEPKPRPTLDDRLWRRIDIGDPAACWEWTGGRSSAGYGYITAGGRKQPVHRVVYELLVGPIPEGLALDHLCRNVRCVNPDHLEPVTWRENVRRGLRCKDGLMPS